MPQNSPESPKVGQLGANNDEPLGIHYSVFKDILDLASKVGAELTAIARRPIGEHIADFSAATEEIRKQLPF